MFVQLVGQSAGDLRACEAGPLQRAHVQVQGVGAIDRDTHELGQAGLVLGRQTGEEVGVIGSFEITAHFGTADRRWHRVAHIGQLVEREHFGFGVNQQIADFAFRLDFAVFVHILLFAQLVGRLLQRSLHQGVSNVDIGLPFVGGLAGRRVLGFDVIHRGQVAVATFVIHREGRAFVVGNGVVAVEVGVDHLGVRWEVQAQLHQRGFTRLAGSFLRDAEHVLVVQVGLARAVDRCRHEPLSGRIDHVVLVVHHERAVAGVDVLKAVGRFERKETVTSDGQVQGVRGEAHVALAELLGHALERHTLAHGGRRFLQRRGGKNITKVSA